MILDFKWSDSVIYELVINSESHYVAGIIKSKVTKSLNLKTLSVSLPRNVRWRTVTWYGEFSCSEG